jgi:uncharacterized protein YjbI with pentapeptide repeats
VSKIDLCSCKHSLNAEDADLSKSAFEEVSLAHSRFRAVSFEDVEIERARMSGLRAKCINLSNSSWEDSDFTGVSIRRGRYEGMTIDGVSVTDLLAAHRALRT